MNRVEIFMSQSVEDDFLQLLQTKHKANKIKMNYTKIPSVMGRGISTPKLGDSVWPELNCSYVIYCDKEEVSVINEIVVQIRSMYNGEGIAAFLSDAEAL